MPAGGYNTQTQAITNAGLTTPEYPDGLTVSGTFTANGASSVTVADARITSNTGLLFTLKTVGGTVGAVPSVKTITAGTGFTVACTASDTSIYNYKII